MKWSGNTSPSANMGLRHSICQFENVTHTTQIENVTHTTQTHTIQAASTGKGMVLIHSKHRVHRIIVALTILNMRYRSRWKTRALATGLRMHPHGTC